MNTNIKECVIYVRVSDQQQYEQGSGLESQTTACLNYAHEHNLKPLEIFQDIQSGKTSNRKGLLDALAFVKSRKEDVYVLMMESHRFMRNASEHFAMKEKFKNHGGILLDIDGIISQKDKQDDPEGYVREQMSAVNSEAHSLIHRRNVMKRQKAHLMNGDWIFYAPCGYINGERIAGKSQINIHDVNGIIVRAMLEKLAIGELHSQKDAEAFMLDRGLLKSGNSYEKAKPSNNRVSKILKNIDFYAGYISYPSWGVDKCLGNHEALISEDTLEQIKTRMPNMTLGSTGKRGKHSKDFPLLHHLVCGECGKTIKNSPTNKKGKMYCYYVCRNKECSLYNKGILNTKLHSMLEKFIQGLSVSLVGKTALNEIFQEELKQHLHQNKQANVKVGMTLNKLEVQLSGMLRQMGEVNERLVARYKEEALTIDSEIEKTKAKKKVESLNEEKKFALQDKVMLIFKSLSECWHMATLSERKLIQQHILGGEIFYHPETGIHVDKLSSLYTRKDVANE